MAKVWIPLPDTDFDVTEVAVPWKLGRTERGTDTNDAPAFVVESGFYVSARWPGDAYLFAKRFIQRLG